MRWVIMNKNYDKKCFLVTELCIYRKGVRKGYEVSRLLFSLCVYGYCFSICYVEIALYAYLKT